MPLPVVAAASPWLAPAITGGASFAGNLLSSAFANHSANKQMDFQERMSNTSHQREVADLKKAGLNPILSARLGGSSTPPGSAAPTPDFSSSARAALDATQVRSSIKLQEAQARNLDVQSLDTTATQASRIDGLLASAHAQLESGNLSAAQKDMVRGQIKSLALQRELLQSQVNLSRNSEGESSASSKFFRGPLGSAAIARRHLGNVGMGVSSAKDAWDKYSAPVSRFLKKRFPGSQPGATGRW